MHLLAKERGGRCLSTEYINSAAKLEWECAEGHQWSAAPNNIKNQGQWCPNCSGNVKRSIEDMRFLAKERGGKCLSTEYKNRKANLEWECAEGHQWEKSANNIARGSWCPICAKNKRKGRTKYSIADMRLLAKDRGGKCLSTEYINSEAKLEWECVKGHVWFANPISVKRTKNKKGSWCPECAGRKKLTIEAMHRIAVERDGKCLSPEYRNGKTKLKWECAKGHVWEAAPADVKGTKNKKGSWCGICAGNVRNSGSIGGKV